MARIELTIAVDYVSHWGWKEGVREIMQNALDAESMYGYSKEVRYNSRLHTLLIRTIGTVLERKTLLLGVTDKRDTGAIGEFGEGYKIGCLALLRSGKSVRINTGGERWTPEIAESAKFKVPVMTFDIVKGGKQTESSIDVTISGILEEEWDEIRNMFACLMDPALIGDNWIVKLNHGRGSATVYKHESLKGKLFVGGIFVTSNDALSYGYDLPPKEIDTGRDRNNIGSVDLDSVLFRIWQGLFIYACKLVQEEADVARATSTT